MGELDEKAFKEACKQRYSPAEADIKAVELCSLWQEKLKNPEWHPFQIVEDDRGNAEVKLKTSLSFPVTADITFHIQSTFMEQKDEKLPV